MLTIGCDPEFVIIDNEGCLIQPNALNLTYSGCLGLDGALFEVRPGYSTNVIAIVDSIKSILQNLYERAILLRDYRWLAGQCPTIHGNQRPLAIGGHIHIGNLSLPNSFLSSFINVLSKGLITGLSNSIDDLPGRAVRHKHGYGLSHACRIQDSTSLIVRRVEYRAPGSFLVSPQVTFLNLIIAKILSIKFMEQYTSFGIISKTSTAILKEVLNIMREPAYSGQEDMSLGADILEHLLISRWKPSWDQDFKSNWEIG